MPTLGLHFDRPYLQLAFVDRKRKLQSAQCFIPPDPFNVKLLYMKDWKGRTASAFPLSIRHLEFKISSRKQVEKGLGFQLETLTQIPFSDLAFLSQITPNETGSKASLFFSTKRCLHDHLEEWEGRGLESDFVTGIPIALARFARFRFPELSSLFVVDLGSQEWTCVWVENGTVKKSFTIPEGVEKLMNALWEDRKKILFQKEIDGAAQQIDLLTGPLHLYPSLLKQLTRARQTLSSTLSAFLKGGGPSTLIFTGRTDAFGRLSEYLIQTQPELSLHQSAVFIRKEELACAISIGSAVESCEKKGLQFLRGESTPRKFWQKGGAWGLGLLCFSSACSLLFLFLGLKQTYKVKALISNATQQWIHEFDSNLRSSEIGDLITIVDKNNQTLPYILQAPTVTQALAWISAHASNLEIIDVQYQLVSYPHVGALHDPYCAKVSLEFRAPNATIARDFHELLLKRSSIINLQKEISWECLSDRYRTSFYLKNKAIL
jgi:hypothetical protein